MASAHAEHFGDGGTGDVGVENANLVAAAGELGCDGARHKRLADASLARKHSDNALDLRQRILFKLRRRCLSAGCLCVLATHIRLLCICWGRGPAM